MVESTVIVQESGKGKFTQEIKMGNHIVIADEPRESGGLDMGPSPYEFVLAGLGACTAMTIRLYADYKKIPLKKVTVKLTIDRSYAKDCKNCESSDSRIDHITRLIQLEGKLSDEQRMKILNIANHCPVHRTLTSQILITSELI